MTDPRPRYTDDQRLADQLGQLTNPLPDDPIEAAARLLYAWNCELADELRGPHGHNTWSGTSRVHQARYIERAVRLRDVLQPAQPPVEPTVAPSALETLAQAVLDGRVALWTSAPDGRTQTKTDIQVDPPRGATS